jgi:hypothetical protein
MSEMVTALIDNFVKQGLHAERDEEGDILIRRNNMTYALCFSKEDTAFSTLVLPNIFEVSEENEPPILFLLNNINIRHKWLKTSIRNNQVCFVIELYMMDEARWTQAIEQCLNVMESGLKLFIEALNHSAEE